MPASSSTESPLYKLPRYAIKKKIASGGMATVYLANDQTLGRDVAIKIMHEHLMQSPESVRRFSTEARAVASLSHDNVIKIYDFGEIESRPFLVMEYIDGPTLASLIERGPLPNLTAVAVTKQIALGLSCAHANGVVHRDIKPDNIMIDHDGCVKVMDFGIAHIVNKESLTLTGALVGSPRFISPEQAEGKGTLSGKTDVFSLGVVLYLSLSGSLPFNADTPAGAIYAIIHATPPPLFKTNGRTLFWISDIVDSFLSKDPASRPDAPTAVARIEEECLRHGLSTGKERLKAFIADPQTHASREHRELFEHYRALALREAKKENAVAALKMMEQAKAFGAIAVEDRKTIDACTRRRFTRRLAARAGAGFIACCAITGILLFYIDYSGESRVAVPRTDAVPIQKPEPGPATEPATPAPTADSGTTTKASGGDTALRPAAGVTKPRNERTALKKNGPDALPKPVATAPGFLSIKTNPPWAKVYIDDIERGVTPAKVTYQVPKGSHDIRILKGGFAEYRKTVAISGADTILIRIQLCPDTLPDR